MDLSLLLTKINKKLFPYRFFLAKMTTLPVIGHVVDKMLFEGDDIIYLPKDNVIRVNKEIEMEDMVLPSRVVEHFIERASYYWIMDTCICRETMQCKDYPIDLGCLFLGEAAKRISPELGRPVTKEDALAHVQRARDAGLVHLIGRNKLDAVWLQTGTPDSLLTICNCCPCCCLWRMLPDLSPHIGRNVTKMPGVTVEVTENCTGCGACIDACFVNVITIKDGKATISEECRGCGRCVEVCPHSAIELTVENEQAVETSIKRISSSVDMTFSEKTQKNI